jgi:citronellyl-CoA synthetase
MVSCFKKSLPAYAVPVFLRVQKQVETTGTFKYQKNKLKEQAFNPEKTDEQILVLLPNSKAYCDMNTEIYSNIQQYQYRF